MTTLSHAKDTVSAHNAAEYMDKSGKSARHKARVLEVITIQQGITCAEIGEETGLGHSEAQRRVSDLKNDGLLRYAGHRKCTIKGTKMSAVYLTKRGADIMNTTYNGFARSVNENISCL